MKLHEFKIGQNFYMRHTKKLWSKWLCTDMGTRTVVGIRVDEVKTNISVLNEDEAYEGGWFNGPPYAVAEHVFDEYDQEGCHSTIPIKI